MYLWRHWTRRWNRNELCCLWCLDNTTAVLYAGYKYNLLDRSLFIGYWWGMGVLHWIEITTGTFSSGYVYIVLPSMTYKWHKGDRMCGCMGYFMTVVPETMEARSRLYMTWLSFLVSTWYFNLYLIIKVKNNLHIGRLPSSNYIHTHTHTHTSFETSDNRKPKE